MKYSPYLDLNRDTLTLEDLMREYQKRRGESPVQNQELSPPEIFRLPKAS